MSNRDFDPRIVTLQEDSGDEIVSVLSSETTRNVYMSIEERPSTPKAIADELDMSIQNVHYHLEKIQDAGLIETSGFEYSEKGREMQIYEPTEDELIICNDEAAKERLDRLLERLIDRSMVAVILAALTHFVLTRLMGIGPSRSLDPVALNPGSGSTAGSEAGHSIPWWEFPALWVLVIALLVAVSYSVWQYRREQPT